MTNPAQIAATCQTCRFWYLSPNMTSTGRCRRHAPLVGPTARFPWMQAEEWCGEHQPKEQTDGE